MIEKMQQITVVCLAKDRQATIDALIELGTVHVTDVQTPASDELTAIGQRLEAIQRVNNRLAEFGKDTDAPRPAGDASAEDLLQECRDLLAKEKANQERASLLARAIDQLSPWGQFDANKLDKLEQAGWHTALCLANQSELPPLPDGCRAFVVNRDRSHVYFLAVSHESLADSGLPTVHFPMGMDLAKLHADFENCQRQLADANDRLRTLAPTVLPALSGLSRQLEDEQAFVRAREGMGAHANLAFLNGYVPDESIDRLRAAARSNGWAIRYRDASPDDENVPTKLRIPRQFKIAQVVFDVIGVLPGYNELDVSVPFTIFLTTFCGFLVGDAGYGLVFAIAAALLWHKYRDNAAKRLPVILLAVFSLAVIAFGAISGNWFGIDPQQLPAFMRGLPWLTTDDANGDHLKTLCFFIGATHLSLARIWSAFRSKRLGQALGHVGWALFLWANYFLVNMLIIGTPLGFLPKALYCAGGILILLFSINWRDFGDVIYSPFTFINSIVDVLSYIRLYAVGLSSLYIAKNFNEIARMVWEWNHWAIPFALIVILLGHCLNIALAAMGILVHGIRLNTLEFSNHIGLNWSGKPYQPLSRTSQQ